MTILNKLEPLKTRIVKGKLGPWLTKQCLFKCKERNYLHKMALKNNFSSDWKSFRRANLTITNSKKLYFTKNLQSQQIRVQFGTQ